MHPKPLDRLTRTISDREDAWLLRNDPVPIKIVIGGAFAVIAFCLRSLFEPLLRGHYPFILFFPALTIAALGGGWISSGVVTLSALAYFYEFYPTLFGGLASGDAAIGVFLVSDILIVLVILVLRRSTNRLHRRQSELIRAQHAQLEQALKAASFGEMAASIAHEVKQPIGAVMTYGESSVRWLSHDPPRTIEALAALKNLLAAAGHLGEVVDQTRKRITRSEFHPEPVEVTRMIETAISYVAGKASTHGIVIRPSFEQTNHMVLGDRVLLQQVVINLLVNAMEAMEENAKDDRSVLISANFTEADAIIEICDCGPGLKEQEADQCFERFHTSKKDGMGLGLPISRSTIESHGGFLSLGNRSDRRGAVAVIRLPICRSTAISPA